MSRDLKLRLKELKRLEAPSKEAKRCQRTLIMALENGFDVQDIADGLRTSYQTVHRWLHFKNTPSPAYMDSIEAFALKALRGRKPAKRAKAPTKAVRTKRVPAKRRPAVRAQGKGKGPAKRAPRTRKQPEPVAPPAPAPVQAPAPAPVAQTPIGDAPMPTNGAEQHVTMPVSEILYPTTSITEVPPAAV